MKKVVIAFWAMFAFFVVCVPSAQAGGRRVPTCTHADLHAGSCIEAYAGRLARVADAGSSQTDRCGATAVERGSETVLCQYDGERWREFSRRHLEDAEGDGAVARGEIELVFDILNPPPESGLVPPVGDGLDGQPHAPRTDDGPAITAAIQYACDHGYDIAYLGPGGYRIGESGTAASFYTGIRIDAKLCPSGIKFYGAGVGRTVLLANAESGQYIVYTTDEYANPTRVHRHGWNTTIHSSVPQVTDISTGVSPPVVTGDDNPRLDDGDFVHVRNCGGTTQVNDRSFRVANCTSEAPYSCELHDEQLEPIDATHWTPFSTETACVINKLNRDFEVDIAYMTIRDDDVDAHSTTVCAPTCVPALEESHGIGVLQSGGFVEIHDLIIGRVGDESIDISAPESPTYVHDVALLDPVVGGAPVYQGVGIRIEDVLIHKSQTIPGVPNPSSMGIALSIDPGSHPIRIVDVTVNRLVVTGLFRVGFASKTNTTGRDGQYVSGVRLTNSAIDLNPSSYACVPPLLLCGSIRLQARLPAFPMEDITISNNYLTGTAYLSLENGAGGVTLEENTIKPIPTVGSAWGIFANAKHTRIANNVVSDFARGCVQYQPYNTNDEANASVTSEIVGNTFRCRSNASSRDPAIGVGAALTLPPAPDDEVYFRINDNTITATSSDFIRYGINVPQPLSNVEICRNTIALDPNIPVSGAVGIWSQSEGQVICDNQISLFGMGVRVDAAGSKVIGNTIHGFERPFSSGILASDSSDLLILRNQVDGYRQYSSSGIEIEAVAASASRIRIVGNRVGAAARGILLSGGGIGLDDVTVSSNVVDLDGFAAAIGIQLEDTTNAQVLNNDLLGLTSGGTAGLLTTGTTDFIRVRGNVAQGGGTLRFGATGGDASCDPTGVGNNSTCSDNDLQ